MTPPATSISPRPGAGPSAIVRGGATEAEIAALAVVLAHQPRPMPFAHPQASAWRGKATGWGGRSRRP
jgi:hypothetical protein